MRSVVRGRLWVRIQLKWDWATFLPPWQMLAMGVVGAAIACPAKCGW